MEPATNPKVIARIEEIRELIRGAQRRGERVGLVPTMGALHEGHLSLVRAAKKATDRVVVTIFVNPIQFCPGEDYEKYPRTLETDCALLAPLGVEAVFAPSARTMYPDGQPLTYVVPERLDQNLCGRVRPGHFRGVCTVVAKLFNICPADEAFFGRKDAQQALIIQRMAADLNMPVKVTVCPTVREPDGLAMSSRNQYLSAGERGQAIAIYRSLVRAREQILQGERDSQRIIEAMRAVFRGYDKVTPEYVSVVSPSTCQDIDRIEAEALIAVAAKLGPTRLIDNMLADVEAGTFEL
jgi:pantoate--beta-alanine ligase